MYTKTIIYDGTVDRCTYLLDTPSSVLVTNISQGVTRRMYSLYIHFSLYFTYDIIIYFNCSSRDISFTYSLPAGMNLRRFFSRCIKPREKFEKRNPNLNTRLYHTHVKYFRIVCYIDRRILQKIL